MDYGNKAQPWPVRSQSRYYSCNDPRQLLVWVLRLRSTLKVQWPNGGHVQCKKVAANQLITIREGSGIVNNQAWSRSQNLSWYRMETQESHDCRVAMLRGFL